AYQEGKLKFTLIGEKLSGDWTLVRTRLPGNSDKEQWLLIKERDQAARPADEYDVVRERPESVVSGAVIDEKTGRTQPAAGTARAKPPSKTKVDPRPAVAKGSKGTGKSASKNAFPQALPPQLATLASQPPAGDWLYEVKYDGYRVMVRFDAKGKVTVFTRNGH